ncbi:MAG TPA: nucleotidyltransferase family protein [Terriglobales bacterium]|nr:nucleotidyltransferase family protein [Terriglobales bacterium]
MTAGFTAVVLAAGKGSRLGELGERYSKPMVPVLGRPMIEWSIERLRCAGADRLVVVAHPDNSRLEEYLAAQQPGVLVVHQRERLGVGDAVLRALSAIEEDAFLCCACDSLFRPDDIAALVELGRCEAGVAAIGVLDMGVAATRTRSAVRVDADRVVEIVEKPSQPISGLVALPIYWLVRELEPYLANAALVGGERHSTTALAAWIAAGKIVRALPMGERLELTAAEDLTALEQALASR